jgi:hypothetical protein
MSVPESIRKQLLTKGIDVSKMKPGVHIKKDVPGITIKYDHKETVRKFRQAFSTKSVMGMSSKKQTVYVKRDLPSFMKKK